MMDITPNKLSIGQLFYNSSEQFLIPAYQRRYAWGENQYAALFDDIEMLRENDNHLFGMILLHTKTHKGGLNRPEIVDGQQRIATLFLLFLSIKLRYLKLGKQDKAKEIDTYLLCKDFDEKVRNKLIMGDLDEPDFKLILRQKDFSKIKNRKLVDAFSDFNDWLEEYNIVELNKFLYKLTHIAVIIRLDVGLAKDAYKLFETINNRGLRLSPTDLIKNFILGHAAKHEDKTLDDIKNIWSEIIINLDEIDTNTFLRQYTCSVLKQKLTMNKLVEKLKDYYMKSVENTELLSEYGYYSDDIDIDEEEVIEENNEVNNDDQEGNNFDGRIHITDFLYKIRDASVVYRKIRKRQFKTKKINKILFNLARIKSLPSYIFLLNLFRRNIDEKKLLKILKLIETFMLRRHVCQYRTGELDEIFSKLINVPNKDIVNSVRKQLLVHLPPDSEFKDHFTKHQFKGRLTDRAKCVLEQIEYYLIEDKGEFELTTGRDLQLEHIIPQTINTKKSRRTYGDWKKYLGKDANVQHRKYVHRIGNMTLLADELNLGAYNNPFSKKKYHYRKSNIKLNKLLCENYSQFRFRQIDKRGHELSNIALKIWSFDE